MAACWSPAHASSALPGKANAKSPIRESQTLPYPLAKARLRRMLEDLRQETPFVLQWARLFYMYGDGQNPNSLFAQLDRAIKCGPRGLRHVRRRAGAGFFTGHRHGGEAGPPRGTSRMGGCHSRLRGILRRCASSSNATSPRAAPGIGLNLGVYPYADYEPMAFWGKSERL